MMLSTVIEPTMLRRWPAKICPVSASMWSWSSRNRCAAAAMLAGSLPTLNAITALTSSVMPCCVTQSSVTTASRIARLRKLALRKTGSTNAPCPLTILKGSAPSTLFCLPPLISIASLGEGTLQPNTSCLLERDPRLDVDRAVPAVVDHEHLRSDRDLFAPEGEVPLPHPVDEQAHLARVVAALDPGDDHTHLADQLLVHPPRL